MFIVFTIQSNTRITVHTYQSLEFKLASTFLVNTINAVGAGYNKSDKCYIWNCNKSHAYLRAKQPNYYFSIVNVILDRNIKKHRGMSEVYLGRRQQNHCKKANLFGLLLHLFCFLMKRISIYLGAF